jgi:hypothetical protein
MFPRGRKIDKTRCPIGLDEAQEFWLGPGAQGSVFGSREELLAAWARGREYVMRVWACDARRPFAWWQLETTMAYPGRDLERSTLWRANQLTSDETIALEAEWKREFATAQSADFTINDGRGELLKGDVARVAHYAWADIPRELIKRWEKAERRRRARMAPEKAPDVVVEGQAEDFTGLQPESNAAAEALK